MSATRILARYAALLNYEDLPPPVVEKAKLVLLDVIGKHDWRVCPALVWHILGTGQGLRRWKRAGDPYRRWH